MKATVWKKMRKKRRSSDERTEESLELSKYLNFLSLEELFLDRLRLFFVLELVFNTQKMIKDVWEVIGWPEVGDTLSVQFSGLCGCVPSSIKDWFRAVTMERLVL